MQVHFDRIPSEEGRRHFTFICSDLHLGARGSHERRIVADLDEARRHGADIIINGDLFDAVPAAPGDKRSGAYNEAKAYRGNAAYQTQRIKLAAKLLEPYADAIQIIGIGNHEESVIRFAGIDLVESVIAELNRSLESRGSTHRIRHGGICGYWVRRFEIDAGGENKTGATHKLWYHHGTGGDSAVTKGMISANRISVNWDYDAMTCGHRHHGVSADDVFMTVSDRGHLVKRNRKVIFTASYYENYRQGNQAAPLDYSYAESKLHAAKPMGGRYLVLTPRRHRVGKSGKSLWYIEQHDASSLDAIRDPEFA